PIRQRQPAFRLLAFAEFIGHLNSVHLWWACRVSRAILTSAPTPSTRPQSATITLFARCGVVVAGRRVHRGLLRTPSRQGTKTSAESSNFGNDPYTHIA